MEAFLKSLKNLNIFEKLLEAAWEMLKKVGKLIIKIICNPIKAIKSMFAMNRKLGWKGDGDHD